MSEKRPVLFIDDESGEPWQLVADLNKEDHSQARTNIAPILDNLLDELCNGQSDDVCTLQLKRIDMTEAEINALPEL